MPLWQAVVLLGAFLFGCWLSGQVVGYIDHMRRPRPAYYLSPVGKMKDIKVKAVEFYPNEWALAEKAGEILRPAKKAEAKEEVPVVETDVESVVRKHFGEYADQALICFKSESGLRPTAFNGSNRNGTWDAGIAQVNQIHCPKLGLAGEACKQALFDIETNIELAYKIFQGRGWNAWYGKACKQFWT